MQTAVQGMVDMGFPREQVMLAMRASFNNPDRAVEYLMTVSTAFIYSCAFSLNLCLFAALRVSRITFWRRWLRLVLLPPLLHRRHLLPPILLQ